MTHVIRTLSREGDTVVAFDPTSAPEVERARSAFNQLMHDQGYLMFNAVANAPAEQIREFDPLVEETLAVPRFAGG